MKKDSKDIDVEIGKRLRFIRYKAGVPMRQIADYLDVSYQQISKYESGQNRISAGTLLRICDFFNITISDFFTDMYYSYNNDKISPHSLLNDKHTSQLLKLWAKIQNNDIKDHVLSIIRTVGANG